MQKTINFCGLCRSGQHAIIFWLLENIAPFVPVEKKDQHWHNLDKKYLYVNNCNHMPFRFTPEEASQYEIIVKSFEDIYLIENDTYYICRDFLNMMASRIKKWPPNGSNYAGSLQNVMNIWINQNSHGSPYAIYYNKWLTDKDYRDEVASRFGLENKDKKLDFVSSMGDGSSFIGRNLEKNKTKYFERYKEVEFDDMMKSQILSNKQLLKLNKEIYGIDIEECLS